MEKKVDVIEEVVEAAEEVGMDVTVLEPTVESGSGVFGKIITGLAVIGSVTGVVYLFKNREEIAERKTEKQIAKLEAKGYVVTKAEDQAKVCNEDEDTDEDVQ